VRKIRWIDRESCTWYKENRERFKSIKKKKQSVINRQISRANLARKLRPYYKIAWELLQQKNILYENVTGDLRIVLNQGAASKFYRSMKQKELQVLSLSTISHVIRLDNENISLLRIPSLSLLTVIFADHIIDEKVHSSILPVRHR
jgi:hypothetical protein